MSSRQIRLSANVSDVNINSPSNGNVLTYINGIWVPSGISIVGSGGGDMTRLIYDSNYNGIVDLAEVANSVAWSGITGKPATFPPDEHTHSGLGGSISVENNGGLVASGITILNFVGATVTSNSNRATITFSGTVVSGTVSSGGGHTIENSSGADMPQRTNLQFGSGFTVTDDAANNRTSVTISGIVSGISQEFADARYLIKASNLSDIPDPATARTNLGIDLSLYAFVNHTHSGEDIVSGFVNPARLGSGSRDGTKFLRDDGVWVTISGAVISGTTTSGGDMYKAVYDTNDDGVVDNSTLLNGHPDTYFAISGHTHSGIGVLNIQREGIPLGSADTLNFVGVGVELNQNIATITFSGATISGIPASGTTVSGMQIPITEHIYNEQFTIVSGTSNFRTSQAFIPDTLRVYYNGLRQASGYFTKDSDNGGFTIPYSPISPGMLTVDYDYLTYYTVSGTIVVTSGTISSGTSSGGGHVIKNASGISMPQREGLQFGSSFTVIDDSINNITRVELSVSGVQSTTQQMSLFTAGNSVDGSLSVTTLPYRIYNATSANKTFKKVFLALTTPPSGQSIIVDILKNDSTIFTTSGNRPQISIGNFTGETTTFNIPVWSGGEYITASVVQVGTNPTGKYLTIHVVTE